MRRHGRLTLRQRRRLRRQWATLYTLPPSWPERFAAWLAALFAARKVRRR
jgi:hypothetical protein